MKVTPIQKSVTITNDTGTTPGDTARWIYPVFVGTNEASFVGTTYDNLGDPVHQSYRIYVGYSQGGTDYAGLAPGQSITFNIPEALWDGGTIQLVTDTSVTENQFWSSGNPFNYQATNSQTYVETLPNNGALLLYRSPDPVGIATTAPGQLVEYSIRDASQTVAPSQHLKRAST